MDGIRDNPSKRRGEVFVFLASLLLGFVFLVSANVHLSNPYGFLSHVYSYDVVSESLGIVVAAFLPSLQLVVGIALLFFPRLRPFCFLAATVLLFAFTVFQLQAHLRGLNIACGCFSNNSEDPITWLTIGRTATLFVIAFSCSCLTRKWVSTSTIDVSPISKEISTNT
jgi:putative oxidoreductase